MNNETTKAFVSALAVVIGTVLGALGIDFDADLLQNALSAILLLASIAWGVWHNHSFTKEAQEADKYMAALKSGELEAE